MKSREREVDLPGLLLLKMKTLLLKMKTEPVLSGGSSFSGHCSSFFFCGSWSVPPFFQFFLCFCFPCFLVSLPFVAFSSPRFWVSSSQFSPSFFSLSVLFFSPSLSAQPLAFFFFSVPPLPGSVIPPLFSSFFFSRARPFLSVHSSQFFFSLSSSLVLGFSFPFSPF